MLRFKRILDRFVKLLVASRGFCGVEIASSYYVAIRRVKVEGACHILEIAERKKLSRKVSCDSSMVVAIHK